MFEGGRRAEGSSRYKEVKTASHIELGYLDILAVILMLHTLEILLVKSPCS